MGLGGDDAGQLDLELDRAVEVQVPEDAVVVVADGEDRADHQATAAAHVGGTRVAIGVLPQNAEVFFVDADRLVDVDGRAVVEAPGAVEIGDVAEAVTPQRERVHRAAERDLADIERILERLARAGLAVGHDHLGHAGAPHDRPPRPLIGPRQRLEDDALGVVHDGSHIPVAPGDQVAVGHGEARTVRLGDVDRFEVVAIRNGPVVVVVRLGRNRPVADVVEVVDLHLVEIDERHQTIDGFRVAVVGDVIAPEHDAAGDAPTLLVLVTHIAGRPRVDLDLGRVVDATLGQRFGNQRTGAHDFLGCTDFAERELRDLAGDGLRRHDRFVGQRHDELLDFLGACVIEPGLDTAIVEAIRVRRRHPPKRRVVADLALLFQQVDDRRDLVGSEKGSRVRCHRGTLIGV